MSPDNYRYAGGSLCPACQGTDLAWGMYGAMAAGVVHQEVECRRCAAIWVAVYALTGYAELARPQEDTP